MNAYDFDKTIYDGDSGVDLIKYTFRKKPFLIIKKVPIVSYYGIKYLFKCTTFEKLKSKMFSFLSDIDNLDEYLDRFVDSHLHKMKEFYNDIRKDDDLIISASIELWLDKFCERMNIKNHIATRYDLENRSIIGKNCSKEEKLVRMYAEYPDAKIETSYSDSKNDIPLLEEAKDAYVVKGKQLIKYHKGYFKK